jgi:hypothetical protein
MRIPDQPRLDYMLFLAREPRCEWLYGIGQTINCACVCRNGRYCIGFLPDVCLEEWETQKC